MAHHKEGTCSEERLMPADPKRVQAAFVAAVEYQEAADRAHTLEHECLGDVEFWEGPDRLGNRT